MEVLTYLYTYMKRSLSWFFVIALIVAGVWFFAGNPAMAPVDSISEETQVPQEKLPANMPTDDMIKLTSPLANAVLTSPINLTGQARGPWYFEASFPIELQKADGTVISTAIGTAQGDWMTENWVPFTALLPFPPQPAGSTGKLVLKKDNPSGEPQNDASVVIPVQF